MSRALFVALGLTMAWGCATGGQANSSPEEGRPRNAVELVVQNDTQNRLSAFIQWNERTPIRLGDVAAGEVEFFNVLIGGREVRVLRGGLGVNRERPGATSPPQDTMPGDRLLWIFEPSGRVHSVRFPHD